MTETTTPVEPQAPVTPPVTPPVEPPASPQQPEAPEGYIKQERYTGAVQKIETLTSSQKELQAQLAERSSQVEQLNSQLAAKDAAVEALKGESATSISELQAQIETSNAQLTELTALKAKVDVIKEMGRPDLLPIVEHLPAGEPEQLKAAIADFASTMDAAVQAREKQLTSGVIETPSVTDSTIPETQEGWIKHIESLPLGTKERMDATDAYGSWLKDKFGPATIPATMETAFGAYPAPTNPLAGA